MPVPKKKTSRSRRNTRRSHDALSRVGMIICSQCGEKKLLHRICPSCGTYRGRKIVSTEEE